MSDLAFVAAGVILGYILALRFTRPAERRRPAERVVPRSSRPTAVHPMLAVVDTRELAAPERPRFAALPGEVLRDMMTQHGAHAAGVWRMQVGTLVREATAGDASLLAEFEGVLEPMIAWSAAEGVVHAGPDGDAPRAIVAPLGVRGERQAGAIALVFAGVIPGDRSSLKEWMGRQAERIEIIDELVRTHDELARANRRTRLLLREAQSWDVEETPDDLGARLCGLIEDLTGADGSALVRWDGATQQGHVVTADGSCAQFAASVVEEDSLAGTACRENVPQLWHEVSGRGEGPEALFSRALPTQTGCVLVQPLRRRGAVIGAVVATHTSSGKLGPGELRALSLFDAVASFRLASAWRMEEVTRRALVDGLTGLSNRVGFDAGLATAEAEQARHRWPVSLVLIDVDNFKLVNDTYGHEVGDAILQGVAHALEDTVRTTDICARVGGDEMAVILKDTDVEGARELAERLRVAVEAVRVEGVPGAVVTASVGVATFPREVAEWSALFRTADQALYRAKASGRNVVAGAKAAGEL